MHRRHHHRQLQQHRHHQSFSRYRKANKSSSCSHTCLRDPRIDAKHTSVHECACWVAKRITYAFTLDLRKVTTSSLLLLFCYLTEVFECEWVSECVHVRDVTERKNSRMQNTKRTTTPKDALTYTEQSQSSTVGNHKWPQHETEEKYVHTYETHNSNN